MATFIADRVRQGLPRSPGGPAWPDVEGAVLATAGKAEGTAAADSTSVAAVQVVSEKPADETGSLAAEGVAAAVAPVVDSVEAAAPRDATSAVAAAASSVPNVPGAAAVTVEVPLRRGLPRVAGGVSWPAAGSVTVERTSATAVTTGENMATVSAVADDAGAAGAAPVSAAGTVAAGLGSVVAEVTLRQGLPRVAGGESWPPAGTVTVQRTLASPGLSAAATSASSPAVNTGEAPAAVQSHDGQPSTTANVAVNSASGASAAALSGATETEEVTLRRGLPRVAGGDAWPAAGTVAIERQIAVVPMAATPEQLGAAASAGAVDAVAAGAAVEANVSAAGQTAVAASSVQQQQQQQTAAADPLLQEAPSPKPETVAVAAKQAPAESPVASKAPAAAKPKREPVVVRGRTLGQWAKLAGLWGGGAIVAAGIIVLAARGVTTLPGVPEFMERYPGEYHLPEFVDPGFPAWARWSHFLNFFLMILIIRSGLLVRQQQKPDAFFTPKKGGKKISIYLWLHTSIDILWLANGVVFVVLLFISGHWARIVPTSWEVFPNALSAALQYLTLEWPVEDGWVNYNSLQQIMYFTVVFIAAPLAAITGVRMSEWWPKDAEKLNKLYPAPVARALHFPVMLFFVLFILVHVFLVFTTGALKNLNHMFVGTPEISWAGFWMFVLGLLVTAAVTWAARPLVLAPIAGAFGRVSER